MIDLDALKAARQEAAGAGPVVTFRGREFSLPAELPFAVPESLVDVAVATEAGDSAGVMKGTRAAVDALLGDDVADFMALRPSMQDIQTFMASVLAEYGFGDVGEPSASE